MRPIYDRNDSCSFFFSITSTFPKYDSIEVSFKTYALLISLILSLHCHSVQNDQNLESTQGISFTKNPNDFQRNYKLEEIIHNKRLIILKRLHEVYRIDIVPFQDEDTYFIKEYGAKEFIRINLLSYFNKRYGRKNDAAKIVLGPDENSQMIVFVPSGSIGTDKDNFKLHSFVGIRAIFTSSHIYFYAAEFIPEEQFYPERNFELYQKEINRRLDYIISERKLP